MLVLFLEPPVAGGVVYASTEDQNTFEHRNTEDAVSETASVSSEELIPASQKRLSKHDTAPLTVLPPSVSVEDPLEQKCEITSTIDAPLESALGCDIVCDDEDMSQLRRARGSVNPYTLDSQDLSFELDDPSISDALIASPKIVTRKPENIGLSSSLVKQLCSAVEREDGGGAPSTDVRRSSRRVAASVARDDSRPIPRNSGTLQQVLQVN